jgi:hypothetical protein
LQNAFERRVGPVFSSSWNDVQMGKQKQRGSFSAPRETRYQVTASRALLQDLRFDALSRQLLGKILRRGSLASWRVARIASDEHPQVVGSFGP